MKLINYKCPKCEYEKEELLLKEEEMILYCPKCKTKMKEWNFKNNNQRYFYCDPQSN